MNAPIQIYDTYMFVFVKLLFFTYSGTFRAFDLLIIDRRLPFSTETRGRRNASYSSVGFGRILFRREPRHVYRPSVRATVTRVNVA